jgi:glycosyltransferase involved in cell wall biosynthesis
MAAQDPKVSIIIATYNREAFVIEAIESVKKQTYADWEMVIIDDASTDGTEKVIKTYIDKDTRIHYFKNKQNLGISKTRNRGIDLAKGEYLATLDSDDIWLDEDKLKKQVEFLDINKDYALIGGGIMYIDTHSRHIRKMLYPIYDSIIRNIMLQYNPFPHSTVLMRKTAVVSVGKYDEAMKACEDYDLWMRLGAKYKFTNIPKVLAGYRVHGGNISRNKKLSMAATVLELVKKYKKYYKRPTIGMIKAYLRLILAYIGS